MRLSNYKDNLKKELIYENKTNLKYKHKKI